MTIIAVGPTPSLAAAVDRDPEFARRCRFDRMHGSFDVGCDGGTEHAAEWNVKTCVPAWSAVLGGAPWDELLLTPLDTCGTVVLRGDHNARA